MRRLLVVLLGLVLAAGMVPEAMAHKSPRPTVSVKRITENVVVLRGKAPQARHKVVVQERRHHRWHRVKKVRIRHHHHFRARVHQDRRSVKYRVVAAGRHSKPVRVRIAVARNRQPAPSRVVPSSPAVPPAAPAAPAAPVAPAPPAAPATPPAVVVAPPAAPETTDEPAAPETTEEPATPDTTEEPQSACGGEAPMKADGTAWTCTFDDEFDGGALDRTKWVPQTNFVSGTTEAHACYEDDPANVSVSDGVLNLTVRKVDQPVTCVNKSKGSTSQYTAGGVMTYRLFSQKYGRFEARYKSQAATQPGLHEAFWLWPDDRYSTGEVWPAAGEIDVAETYSDKPDNVVPFLHTKYDVFGSAPYELVGPATANTAWTCKAQRGVFNTYTLDWSPTSLSIYVNGKLCMRRNGDVSAFQKPYIIALTQLLGTGTNQLSSDAMLPATMQVDYVRVWR